jgi:tellurite resistance protein
VKQTCQFTPMSIQPTTTISSTNHLYKLLEALQLYTETFGKPKSDLDLKATVAALMTVMGVSAAAVGDLDAFAQKAVDAFKKKQVLQTQLTEIVKQAQGWLQKQEGDLLNVVSSYVQQFAPAITQSELIDVLPVAIAILNSDGKVSPAEGKFLIQKVLGAFDLDLALRRWIPPQFIDIAHRVANYRKKATFESALFSLVQAYLLKFQPLLNPELIQQIIATGSANIDPKNLTAGDIQDIAKTVVFKMKLLEASPPTTKTDLQMAEDIHKAIQAFKSKRPSFDATQGVKLGDLEVSSPFKIGDR